jgi:glycosyltransferase involved in cell wall biosynthesis
MVSTSYPSDASDWKGLFIRHLVDALARRSDVCLRLWAPPGIVPDQVTLDLPAAERNWLAHLAASGGIAHLLRAKPLASVPAVANLIQYLRRVYLRNSDASVYHVNWLQNGLALPRNGRPALLSVLGTDMQLLRLPGMVTLIRHRLRGRPAVICPNAEWMVPKLDALFGEVATIQYVPFGIDPTWLALNRQTQDIPKWLVVSRLTRDKLGPLFEWARPYFEDGNRELHLFGPMQEQIELPAWVRYHGSTTPEALAAEWFPKAAGLITLSRHAEGRPQVMLEAMASGLPIIASRIPAHEDLLRHRDTGWICDRVGDLAEALQVLEHHQMNQEIGGRARAWVKREVGTWDDCAQRYVDLYSRLLRANLT